MPTFSTPGVHFTDPWEFTPYQAVQSAISNTALTVVSTDDTTAFFTNMATSYGIQDTTNWTEDTYKTLLTVTGKGLVSAIIGPSVAATDVTTFEITVDGVLTEISGVSSTNTDRFCLLVGAPSGTAFSSTDEMFEANTAQWKDTSKTILTYGNKSPSIIPWSAIAMLGTPCLKFKQSLLIRAKNSADVTNSTATAYSAVAYRVGL